MNDYCVSCGSPVPEGRQVCWACEMMNGPKEPAPKCAELDASIAEIQSLMSVGERLVQLAEEATELAKAALKMRRTIIPDNPTPVTKEEAYQNLLEELADVSNCLASLDLDGPFVYLRVRQAMTAKAARWVERVKEAKAKRQAAEK